VVVLVRPESIKVLDAKETRNGWNSFAGVIETVTFHGAVTRLGVNVGGQRVVADVTYSSSNPLSLGQKVWLAFMAQSCQVMAKNK